MNDNKASRVVIILSAFSVGVLLLAPFIGATSVPLRSVFLSPAESTAAAIFWELRVPRVLLSFFVGAGLAIGGMVFQAVFRNFLASPFTLGVSSGAAFGAALYFQLGFSAVLFGISGSVLFALLGAFLTVVIIYSLSGTRGRLSTTEMLLAGVVLNFFFSGFILFLQYIADFAEIFRMTRWLMGGLYTADYFSMILLGAVITVCSLLIFSRARDMNLLLLGEDLAVSRGLNVARERLILFLVVSLMVGFIVSFCGPIGFVGIMIPHICRLLIGSNHSYLMPATFLFGGAFLTLCDTLARTIIAPYEIPVGVITALLGGPFFLWLLMSQGKSFRLA